MSTDAPGPLGPPELLPLPPLDDELPLLAPPPLPPPLPLLPLVPPLLPLPEPPLLPPLPPPLDPLVLLPLLLEPLDVPASGVDVSELPQ
jgi:hypothetical protein